MDFDLQELQRIKKNKNNIFNNVKINLIIILSYLLSIQKDYQLVGVDSHCDTYHSSFQLQKTCSDTLHW